MDTGDTYGLAGERQTMTLPGGGTWTYTEGTEIEPKDDPNSVGWGVHQIQDDGGRIVQFGLGMHGELCQAISNVTYNGSSIASYCEADYYPDGQGRLSRLTNTFYLKGNGYPQWTGTILSQNVYTMDTAGNRLTNAVTDNTGTTRTEVYGYDELNRLTSVDYGDGQTQSYQFDPMSNRLQKADSVTGTENYSYNNANMLLSRGTNAYTNDLEGNTLTGGGRTNSWDSQNRMVQCVNGSNTSTFVYGADGYRHRSTVNGMTTDFALDGDTVVRELRAGASYATYLTGASGPMYKLQNTNGTIRWYFFDGLGSVLGEVDPSGSVTTYARYDVYGSVRSRAGTATSAHGFVGALGHTSEAETGLIYMRARCMDPVTGRFVSEDPAGDGPNWFAYAGSNPVTCFDPTGRSIASPSFEQRFAELLAKWRQLTGDARRYDIIYREAKAACDAAQNAIDTAKSSADADAALTERDAQISLGVLARGLAAARRLEAKGVMAEMFALWLEEGPPGSFDDFMSQIGPTGVM